MAITPEEALAYMGGNEEVVDELERLIDMKLGREFTSENSVVTFDLEEESGMTSSEAEAYLTEKVIQAVIALYKDSWDVTLNRGSQKELCLVLSFSKKKKNRK